MPPATVFANEYSASFKGTDIQEFINIVGRNLEKTIIVDPSVRGKIDVRSYDMLSEEQYYSFFLNVLEVYGYAVVEMDNGVIKVIKSKDAKTSAIPVVGDGSVQGDEVVTRVVAVRNVSVRELSLCCVSSMIMLARVTLCTTILPILFLLRVALRWLIDWPTSSSVSTKQAIKKLKWLSWTMLPPQKWYELLTL